LFLIILLSIICIGTLKYIFKLCAIH